MPSRRLFLGLLVAGSCVVSATGACDLAGGTGSCGSGTFCSGVACVQCLTADDCSTDCACVGGSCSCDAAGAAAAFAPVVGAQCTRNADCGSSNYCFIGHCLANGTLSGCAGAPLIGSCRAEPAQTAPPLVITSAPDCADEGYTWRLAFIITVAVLVCLILGLLLYICLAACGNEGDAESDERSFMDMKAVDDMPPQSPEKVRSPHTPGVYGDLDFSNPNSPRGDTSAVSPAGSRHASGRQDDDSPDFIDIPLWFWTDPTSKLGLNYKGRRVTQVDPNGLAHEAGVKEGMVIKEIAGVDANSAPLRQIFTDAVNGPQPFAVLFRGPPHLHQQKVHVGDTVEVKQHGEWVEATVVGVGDTLNSNGLVAITATPAQGGTARQYSQYRKKDAVVHTAAAGDLPSLTDLGQLRSAGSRDLSGRSPRRERDPKSSVGKASWSMSSRGRSDNRRSHSGSKSSFRKGDKVAANYNGTWFPGVILHAKGSEYTVDWGDGSMTDGLSKAEMWHILPPKTRVVGLYQGEWWPGSVVELAPNCTYTVKWDDATLTFGMNHEDVKPHE